MLLRLADRENQPPPPPPDDEDGGVLGADRLEEGRGSGLVDSEMIDEVAEGSFWWLVESEGGGFLRRSLRGFLFVGGVVIMSVVAGDEVEGQGSSASEARRGASEGMSSALSANRTAVEDREMWKCGSEGNERVRRKLLQYKGPPR